MIILSFILGVLLWTFAEYMLHRFLGHEHKGRNFFKREHVQHHAKFNYFAPAYKKVISASIVFMIFFLFGNLFAPILIVLFFLIGFFGMYALYEAAHFRYHAKDPLVAPFIILRKHHFYHHFHNPKMNHGVTTRFWDRVFGTFIPMETVNIPEKMTMNWLTNDGEIKNRYAVHFRIINNNRK